ncbi:DMT family transporter [Pseudonocardia alni]|uniref:DMT family transporter n=1 Tax=Pseudonocardia alni TaxID=33907 RepID=UPI00280BF459|nr:SMR family transporter [Pseudonocardia alni]
MTKWLLLAGAIACEVTGSLSLQAASRFGISPWLALVVVGYATSFALLGLVLGRGVPVGVAYGIWGPPGSP